MGAGNKYSKNSLEYTLKNALDEGRLQKVGPCVEKWLVTSDRFNAWFLHVAKWVYDDEKMMYVLEVSENSYNETISSWQEYETTRSPTAEEQFRIALSRSCDVMTSLITERPER